MLFHLIQEMAGGEVIISIDVEQVYPTILDYKLGVTAYSTHDKALYNVTMVLGLIVMMTNHSVKEVSLLILNLYKLVCLPKFICSTSTFYFFNISKVRIFLFYICLYIFLKSLFCSFC